MTLNLACWSKFYDFPITDFFVNFMHFLIPLDTSPLKKSNTVYKIGGGGIPSDALRRMLGPEFSAFHFLFFINHLIYMCNRLFSK